LICLDLFRNPKSLSLIETRLRLFKNNQPLMLGLKCLLYIFQIKAIYGEFIQLQNQIRRMTFILPVEQLTMEYGGKELFTEQQKLLTKLTDIFEQGLALNNPLIIFNYLIFNAKRDDLLTYSPIIYSRLSEGYKKQLYHVIQSQYYLIDKAETYYEFACCFKKMKLYSEMSQAFHHAIQLDGTGKYRRKLVKTLENLTNSPQLFYKCKFNFNYLKNALTNFIKNLSDLDQPFSLCSVGEHQKIQILKREKYRMDIRDC